MDLLKQLIDVFLHLKALTGATGAETDAAFVFCAARGSEEDKGTAQYLQDLASQAGFKTQFENVEDIGIDALGRFTDSSDEVIRWAAVGAADRPHRGHSRRSRRWPTARINAPASCPPLSPVPEPRAVIGRNVRLGERTRIMAGAVIEHDAQVGSDTVVHPNAVIGYGCVVGNEAAIGAGSVIGSEGYGFAQDQHGKSHPIPQTGIVVLGDRVRVGANCCIDRAAYRTTLIGAGTKLDNLCHIVHNVQIGEDCLLTSMFCVAGSTTIGNRVMTSGQTGIKDHVKICDDVVLVHRAGVTADIDQPGAYAGLPVQPLKEYMRNTAVLRMLADLRQRLLAVERRDEAPAA